MRYAGLGWRVATDPRSVTGEPRWAVETPATERTVRAAVTLGHMAKPRRDTRLETEGAEFLVLAHLLVEGIHAFKAYTNFPGWDLIAFNPGSDDQAEVQVKSRWYIGAKAFPIKNFDSDFVACVVLNRARRNKPTDGPKPPEIYVVPTDVVEHVAEETGGGSSFSLLHLDGVEDYRDNWGQVREVLKLPPK
jgi:hypothetical protein